MACFDSLLNPFTFSDLKCFGLLPIVRADPNNVAGTLLAGAGRNGPVDQAHDRTPRREAAHLSSVSLDAEADTSSNVFLFDQFLSV
jgi:hypothetical protein